MSKKCDVFARFPFSQPGFRDARRICRIGFSPRKPHLVFYIGDYPEQAEMLARLGKYKRDGGCIYVTKLADVDLAVLEEMISRGLDHMNRTHPKS